MSVNPLPSKLINNRSTHTNFPPTHFQPTPTGGENFWPDFTPLRFFSKMFLTTKIAQISSGGLFRPTLQSEKKTFGGQKKRVIPYFHVINVRLMPENYFEMFQ